MTNGPPRVLVIEDDEAVRDSLAAALRHEGYLVTSAPDGENLDGLLARTQPDLAILDVYLPRGPSGFDIGRRLRGRSSAPVLFLTAADEVENRVRGFEVGADDYVVKPFALSELLMRVRALLRRTGRQVSHAIQVRDVVLDEDLRVVTRAGQPIALTDMEFDVLRVLLSSPGAVVSKTQLLVQVWGFGGYDTNLVEVYVSALRRKLEQHGPRIIHTERGRGYVVRH